jgi:hypothetical protein
MTHTPSEVDPQPDLPSCFKQPLATPAQASPATKFDPAADRARPRATLFRTGLATLEDSDDFGWQAAATAEGRGVFSAQAKALVSDGQAYNWTIHRRHFSSFEPILEFVHACEHVHAAARAADKPGGRWAELCWQGRVADVLSEIAERRRDLTPPANPAEEPEHPWCVLSREHGSLTNNRSRMDYPRYRREGLPITSSPIESWVKQLNQRVKGSEKFWNDDQNGEAVLHLRSAWLGDDDALIQHLANRPGHPAARPGGAPRSARAD